MDVRLLAFLGVAIVLTVTPGPDFALVTRVGLSRGRVAAWFTSLGVVTGHVTWGLTAGAGVASLLYASAALYNVLRLAGAVYLIWLGVHALLARDTAPTAHDGARATVAQPVNQSSATVVAAGMCPTERVQASGQALIIGGNRR